MIRAVMSSKIHSFIWVTTFIYAPPKRCERVVFWRSFIRMAKESQLPWLCIGDYNEIGSIWEKQGGVGCSSSWIESFQQTISECALIDLEFKGDAFTWTNNNLEKQISVNGWIGLWQMLNGGENFPKHKFLMRRC